jgi:ferredoxin-nitrite reductase
VRQIWDLLESVGLVSLQTGMDNIRNVVGCPAAGLTANELLDASPVVLQYNDMFVGNPAYTNLPRKFNVTITGCLDHCTHGPTQDISLIPAVRFEDGDAGNGEPTIGFNVAAGGKQGSGGFRPASPLDVFVTPANAAEVCNQITLIFRDHGPREARNKCRLAFLVDEWGVPRFREELDRRMGYALPPAGQDVGPKDSAPGKGGTDHMGIFAQKQPGLNAAGLVVPAGRISSEQLLEVARLADHYGDGQVRLTPGQNLIIPNVPDARLESLKAEPLLAELRHDAPEIMRGLVSCTGIDYCHFALIETKERAIATARKLEQTLGDTGPLTMHWSGCPNACGNHTVSDIGILGKRTRIDGQVVDAVDVSLGGRFAGVADSDESLKGESLTNVPCADLPALLERVLAPKPAVAATV